MAAGSGEDIQRLTAVIARQQGELDRVRSAAVGRSIVERAKGVLMERLSCSSAEAAEQLAQLAAQAGIPLTEMAAELVGTDRVPPPAQELHPPWPAKAAVELAAAAAEIADDGAEFTAALLDQALAPVGAAAVALWLLEPDGCLQLAGEAGIGPPQASRWRRIPPQMDCLAQRVVHDGRDLWWSVGRPDGESTPLIGGWPRGARAVLALRDTRAAMMGVMEVCWPEPLAEFPNPLRRQLATLANVCAQVLGVRLKDGDLAADGRPLWLFGLLGGLLESALFAHAVRDDTGRVADFSIGYVNEAFRDPAGRSARELVGRTLLEAYPATAVADGVFDRAVQALATGVPERVTGAVTSSLTEDAAVPPVLDVRIAQLFDGVVITWPRPDEADRLGSLLEHAQRLGRIGGWEENLITGEVGWTDSTFALFGVSATQHAAIPIADLRRYAVADDIPALRRFREALLRNKEATSATFRVVRQDDGSVRQMRVFAEPVVEAAGAVVALRGVFQDISAQYHAQVALAASEQRADDEHRLALRLQQAIMPAAAPPAKAAGIDIAVRYRPAGPEHLAGGDWCDAILLPTKEVLLVVGDIAGHGIDAVTEMVAMRNCLRGLAITGAGPAELLGWLNRVACHLTDNTTGTVVCGLYNPANRVLRWARAGHLPPVLVRDETASALSLPDGVLLGIDPGSRYQEIRTVLQPGDAVVMFTDGLIERRGVPIDAALDSFAKVAGRPVASAAQYADQLFTCEASDTGDDACLVAVHVR